MHKKAVLLRRLIFQNIYNQNTKHSSEIHDDAFYPQGYQTSS
jgi:hypothetical protein